MGLLDTAALGTVAFLSEKGFNPLVVGDIFGGLTSAAKTTQQKLGIFGLAMGAVAAVAGFLFFSFGQRASESGKGWIKNGLITICGITAVTSLVSFAVSLFSQGGF